MPCKEIGSHMQGVQRFFQCIGNGDVYKRQVRVSLANLNEADYVKIGKSIKRVLEEYAKVWKASIG